MTHVRLGAALLLLALQLGAIVYARFVNTRYFCWAPFDMQTDYALRVTVNDQALAPDEIRARYRILPRGTDNRSYQHVMDIVSMTERRYHAQDQTLVEMTFQVNGGPVRSWVYRQP